jgi:RNA 3'-terminal phosphate cyclase (ATP)
MLELDGAHGEGGGQILRTALAASVTTARAFEIDRIRAGRRRPGLLPQHLAAIRAAAAISNAEVDGATPGSKRLTFIPHTLVDGHHHIDIGSAGSAGLVAQLAVTALRHAAAPSTVTVVGGTHNRQAPPADFLDLTYLPLLLRTGGRCRLRLERHGFEPAGGGRLTLQVEPAVRPVPLALVDDAPARPGRARALVSRLPRTIAERELRLVTSELGWPEQQLAIEEVEADGPGNVLLLELERPGLTEVISGFGRPGLPAEQVARQAIAQARRRLQSRAPVGPELADQLLTPLALEAGGTFRTVAPTTHFTTNADTLRRFIDVPIRCVAQPDGAHIVTVKTVTDDHVGASG